VRGGAHESPRCSAVAFAEGVGKFDLAVHGGGAVAERVVFSTAAGYVGNRGCRSVHARLDLINWSLRQLAVLDLNLACLRELLFGVAGNLSVADFGVLAEHVGAGC
jgi:hypothetical protein